jgi:hypothetical protein
VRYEVDAVHGGRWPALYGRNGRQWLWRSKVIGRDEVRPGDAFVDAGGLEECLPTITGVPDHGDVWSRPWMPDGDGLAVDYDGGHLHRTVSVGVDGIHSQYRLDAPVGHRFIWAAHTLIDVAPGARILIPEGRPTRVDDTDCSWPWHGDTDLSLLGPDDGTAHMIIIPSLPELTVVDGDDRLTFRLTTAGQPFGMAIWRNLGGWPDTGTYRSVGIEPMLGHSASLALAGAGEAAEVPPAGHVEWSLTIDDR